MRPSGNATWGPQTPITSTTLNNIENALKALQVLATAPAASLAGRLVLVTSDGRVYRDDGAAVAALALLADVTNHTGAVAGAHAATAIGYGGGPVFTGTTVEAALDEVSDFEVHRIMSY